MIRTSLAVLLALASAVTAAAKDLRVSADGSGDYTTLLPALKAAVPGDVIVIQKPSGMVGIVLKKDGDQFVAQSVIAGSPAEAAGVKAGDKVLAVNGSNIAPLSIQDAVSLIRGPVGTTVKLKIAGADGAAARETTIARGAVRSPVQTEADKLTIARSEKDDAASFEIAGPLAKDGVVAAQSFLAFAYYSGLGTSKNPKESARWAQSAVNGGNIAAERLLGVLYASGFGVSKDPEQSFRWTLAAAEKGDVFAMINVTSDYERGFGTTKNAATALDWARRAAAPSPWHTPESLAWAKAAVARLDPSGAAAPEAAEHAPAQSSGAWWESSAGTPAPSMPASRDRQAPNWTEAK